ncbi:MAG: exo-alpha-sialidase [Asticcacaulis sp.]
MKGFGVAALVAAMGLLMGAAVMAAPYQVADGVFEPSKPDLGLKVAEGTETFTVFAPKATEDRFNNGVVLIPFKGRLYAQWQSSYRDEDSPDTWVAFSHSADGEHWSAPEMLTGRGQGGGMYSSGGWLTDGETLVAFVNVWPTGFQSGDGGFTDYRLSTDGINWSAPQRVTDTAGNPVAGIIEQDPHRLKSGRIVTAFHQRPGLVVSPFYTDDPLGVSGWVKGALPLIPHNANAPHGQPVSRELEPSLFEAGDCVVMVFRDQASSYRQLASQSCDGGNNWSLAEVTNMPDSRSKQSAGNLPDGRAYLVNAPNADRVRIPLAITTGDGRCFNDSYLLRGAGDLQPLRTEGKYKRPGYHYPKSVVWGAYLYVGYATNKEDVQVTRVPLSSLKRGPERTCNADK